MIFDRKNKESIHSLFNQIAPNYDLINHFISFGMQNSIKSSAVKNSIKKLGTTPRKVLDLCCGTGDISILFQKLCPAADIIGIDFSEEMLSIAKLKASKINFLQGDITKKDGIVKEKFDICFISFGLRNLPNIDDFLENVKACLKDGGVLAILDLGKPLPIMKPYFYFHYNFIIPLFAKIFNKDITPYKYLSDSTKTYPSQKEILQKLKSHGYIEEENKNFWFGIIALQCGKYSRHGE